jgi:hypothetical protein
MFFRSNIVRLGGSPVALLQQTFVVSNQGEMIVADLRTNVSEGSAAIQAAMEGLAAAAPACSLKSTAVRSAGRRMLSGLDPLGRLPDHSPSGIASGRLHSCLGSTTESSRFLQ